MKRARGPIAAMVTVGAVVVALAGAACSAPPSRQAVFHAFRAPKTSQKTSQKASPVAAASGDAMSVVSLAPGIVWAGLSYQATLVVAAQQLVTVQNIAVGVRAANGARYDFPGMHPATVDGRYVFTSLPRQFSAGVYTEFGTYESRGVWYQLPAHRLRVLAGPSSQQPNPPPVGIGGRWASTLNAGPGYRHGAVTDTVSGLLTWDGASGARQRPNNYDEDVCYSAANVTLRGTVVDLSLTKPARSQCAPPRYYDAEPFYGARINTPPRQDIEPGAAVEAEIYVPPAADGTIADWPAFWMTGPKWPTSGEIDVLEGLSGRGCYHFHFGSHTRPSSTGRCTSISPGWHIFGVDWQPATQRAVAARPGTAVSYRMTFYYDGNAVGTIVQGGVAKRPMSLLLEITHLAGSPARQPATMRVAYVRAWSGS